MTRRRVLCFNPGISRLAQIRELTRDDVPQKHVPELVGLTRFRAYLVSRRLEGLHLGLAGRGGVASVVVRVDGRVAGDEDVFLGQSEVLAAGCKDEKGKAGVLE